jgi:hypothetical protein
MQQIALRNHYILAVYQFTHDIDGAERWRYMQTLGRHWEPWWCRLERENDEKDRQQAFEDTFDHALFFLPYLRDLLFPEMIQVPEGEPGKQCEDLRKLVQRPLDKIVAQMSQDAVIHLTLRDAQLAPFRQMQVTKRSSKHSITCDWIDIYFFPQRIGFLVFKLHAAVDYDYFGLLNAMDAIRHVYAPTIRQEVSTWQCMANSAHDQTNKFTARDLIDYLLQGTTERKRSRTIEAPTITEFLMDVNRPRFTRTRDGQVYGETFRLYTAAEANVSVHHKAERPFESLIDQISFELTNGRLSVPGGDYEPHPSYIASLHQSQRIAQWANWTALALPDRVSFLVHGNAKPFVLNNFEADYFLLYILALYQKMRLSLLAGELQRSGTSSYRNLIESQSIQQDFVLFRNHYLYHEVTHKPLGGVIYQCFQRALGVTEMYDTINDEVQQILEHYEARQQRDTNRMLTFITVAGLGLVLIAMAFDYAGHVTLNVAQLGWLGIGVLSLIVVYVGIDQWTRMRERQIADEQSRRQTRGRS